MLSVVCVDYEVGVSKCGRFRVKFASVIIMSIFRADSLQLSFLDELFTDDFPELPNILMQDDQNFEYLNTQEPLDYLTYQAQTQELKKTKRKSRWTEAEDSVIIDLVEKYGHSWKYFAKYLPERPADSIKSRYYSYLKKKHAPKPCRNLSAFKPCLLSPQMNEEALVDSLLSGDTPDTASTCSHLTAEQAEVKDNAKKSVLKRLYAKMSSLEKVLARTFLEIDRLQNVKGPLID
jgi:hypothetical protein